MAAASSAAAVLLGALVLASASCIGDPPSARPTERERATAQRGEPRKAPRGAAASRSKRAQPVAELDVPQRPEALPIAIDGKLGEPAWRAAADTGAFVHPGTGRFAARLPVQGRAKLLWDETFLYVGFEVSDRTVTGGFPADARDPHLWERDTVEIMIDPDGDGDNRDYYEVQVNPQNLVFDSRFDRYNQPRGGPQGPFGHEKWSAKLTSAVAVHGTLDDDSDRDQGYTVELKLPWSSLEKARRSPPKPGDRWRMNLYAMQNNGGVAWSPILGQGNFHRASRFGRVRWLGKAVPEAGAPRSSP